MNAMRISGKDLRKLSQAACRTFIYSFAPFIVVFTRSAVFTVDTSPFCVNWMQNQTPCWLYFFYLI